jgi:hypothetical protein
MASLAKTLKNSIKRQARSGTIINYGVNHGVVVNGCIITGSAEEKTYNNKTLDKVDADTSAVIKGCKITKKCCAGTSLEISDSHIGGKIDAGTSLSIDDSTCEGDMHAGTSLQSRVSKCSGHVKAGTSLTMSDGKARSVHAGTSCRCNFVYIAETAKAGTSLSLHAIPDLKKATAGTSLYMTKCKDITKARAGTEAKLEDCIISKSLTCAGLDNVIDKSRVEKIVVRKVIGGGTIITGGNIFGNICGAVIGCVTGGNNIITSGSNITVCNGVTTINGQRISNSSAQPLKQIVTLKHISVVGDIHFESGIGEVHVHKGCVINGRVTGGVVVNK